MDLKIDVSQKDELPFPGLESRNASAIIFSFYSTKKDVIKKCLVLSKSSRAFIISQKGLAGFLIDITPENYTHYILNEQMPEILKLRQKKELEIGKKTITWKTPIAGTYSFSYEGELMNGLAHGVGKMVNEGMQDCGISGEVEGMFLNDAPSGFCKFKCALLTSSF